MANTQEVPKKKVQLSFYTFLDHTETECIYLQFENIDAANKALEVFTATKGGSPRVALADQAGAAFYITPNFWPRPGKLPGPKTDEERRNLSKKFAPRAP